MLRGMILTEEDEKLNFNIINDSVDFILLRAGYTSYGIDKKMYKDSRFDEYYDRLTRKNKEIFVYYESCATNEAEAINEANYFINILKNKKITNSVFLFMNDNHNTIIYSKKNQKELSTNELIKIINEFTLTMNSKGYEVIAVSELLDRSITKKIKVINEANYTIILLDDDIKDDNIEIVLEHNCFIDKIKNALKFMSKKIKNIISKLFKLSK